MCASPLSFLRSGPPPPKVVLLPDGLFFSRAVPITPAATPAEAASQIELALEALSPFPIAQLYYGWYWVPGAEQAFVYAAYRRRFTSEQALAWGDAELVIPASSALLGGKVEPAITLLLASPEGLTAVHWSTADVPSQVVFRAIEAETPEDERARIREDVLRGLGGSRTVIDVLVPPAPDPSKGDGEIAFRSGDFVSRLPAVVAASLDVRDKGELAALRAARKRDLVFWRVAVGCAAALVLFGALELALVGGRAWQNMRVAQLNRRAPTVQKIQEAAELATGIHDLVTKRFLPLEMITSVVGTNADRKPGDIVITRVQSSAASGGQGSYTLVMELQTTNPAQVPVYRNEVQKLAECESVTLEVLSSSGDRSLYRMTVVFKPGALKPDAA